MLSGSIPFILLIAAVAPPALAGQAPQALIAGPSLGFVYDTSARSLKPLLGNPAAAMIGPALDLGAQVSAAAISPAQDYALATLAGGQVMLVRLDGGSPQTSVLDVLPAAPDRVALSPGGHAAALYYAASQSVQVVSGLPAAPVFSSIDAALLAGAPDALAISDDGHAVLAGVHREGSGQVYLLTSSGGSQSVLHAGRVAAIAFLHESRDALVADAAAHQLLRLSQSDGGPTTDILARQADGVADPVALAASADNRFALLANASSVAVVDLESRQTTVVQCQCAPTSMAGLRGQTVYRLNDPSDQPISLLNVGGARPIVEIIPPEPRERPAVAIRLPERGVRQ